MQELPVTIRLHRVASQLEPRLLKWPRMSPRHLRPLPDQIPCQTLRLFRSLCQRRYPRKKPQTWAHQALIPPIPRLLR